MNIYVVNIPTSNSAVYEYSWVNRPCISISILYVIRVKTHKLPKCEQRFSDMAFDWSAAMPCTKAASQSEANIENICQLTWNWSWNFSNPSMKYAWEGILAVTCSAMLYVTVCTTEWNYNETLLYIYQSRIYTWWNQSCTTSIILLYSIDSSNKGFMSS